MPNTKPPSTLPKTSEEPSQPTVQIPLLTHANALNHVFPPKAPVTRGAQPGSPPAPLSHLLLHQQLFTAGVSPSNYLRHGVKDPSAQSPRLAAQPTRSSAPPHAARARCVPGAGGEHAGILVSLTRSGIPGRWEGWTTGMRTSPENPAPLGQPTTPARSPRTAIYNRATTTASSTAAKHCILLNVCSPG